MRKSSYKLIIESVKQDGKQFRPSDWIERISANMGSFGSDHRLHYADTVKPAIINGQKCLIVDQMQLEQHNPEAFNYIMQFAETNRLRFHKEDLNSAA